MMGCSGIEIRERTISSSPRLGVTPPSSSALQSSTRCAPPRCAASAEATASTHTSISRGSVIFCRNAGAALAETELQPCDRGRREREHRRLALHFQVPGLRNNRLLLLERIARMNIRGGEYHCFPGVHPCPARHDLCLNRILHVGVHGGKNQLFPVQRSGPAQSPEGRRFAVAIVM